MNAIRGMVCWDSRSRSAGEPVPVVGAARAATGSGTRPRSDRPLFWQGRGAFLCLAILATLTATACSESTSPEPDSDLAPLVGDWNAQSFVVTSQADPARTAELAEIGATFRFSLQPSGRYQASLTLLGATATEFGTAILQGSELTLLRDFPSPDTTRGSVSNLTTDSFELLSETSFTFVQEEGPEAADFVASLLRDPN